MNEKDLGMNIKWLTWSTRLFHSWTRELLERIILNAVWKCIETIYRCLAVIRYLKPVDVFRSTDYITLVIHCVTGGYRKNVNKSGIKKKKILLEYNVTLKLFHRNKEIMLPVLSIQWVTETIWQSVFCDNMISVQFFQHCRKKFIRGMWLYRFFCWIWTNTFNFYYFLPWMFNMYLSIQKVRYEFDYTWGQLLGKSDWS